MRRVILCAAACGALFLASFAVYGLAVAAWVSILCKVWPWPVNIRSAWGLIVAGAALARALEYLPWGWAARKTLNALAGAAGWLYGHAYALGKKVA